jgi:hypothetical protein
MIIGLDFDNTIINYDRVFRKVALEQDLVPQEIPASKVAVRDYLREQGREDAWTEMQGYVYGMRLKDAEPYEGVLEFLARAREHGLVVSIVSHKTRFPYLGRRYDLHGAARAWIDAVLHDEHGSLVSEERVFFHETKSEKIARIAELRCDVYLDDLPEILGDPQFPTRTRPLLFDPLGQSAEPSGGRFTTVHHWRELDLVLASL